MNNAHQDRICSKVCWELLELTEHQADVIKRLTHKVKELERIINAE